MSRSDITRQIAAALEHLAIAQTLATKAAADSFTRDIPDGRSHRYAIAYGFSEHIRITSNAVRNLLDSAAGVRTVQPPTRVLPAHTPERDAVMDRERSAGRDMVHTGSGFTPGRHD